MKCCFRLEKWLKVGCLMVACGVVLGCSAATKTDDRQGKPSEVKVEGDGEFVYPEVPASIMDKKERLIYTLEHFWDKWAFADTTAANWNIGEQGFADFLDLLKYTDTATVNRAVAKYIEKGFARKDLRMKYEGLIDHYLGDPNSPLRNDVVYAYFLKRMIPCYEKEETTYRERAEYRLNVVSKNNPGSKATDFEYIDRQGRHGKLSTVKDELIVMVFNDPDCETCQRLMPQLLQESRLQRPGITVLAIYPGEDTQLWEKDVRQVPANWIDAYSPKGKILAEQLYNLPAMPSLYLLDGQHRVLMKDVEPQTLMQVLDEHERRKGHG